MRVPTIQSRRAAAPGPIAITRPTTPTACSVPEPARAAIAQRTHRLHPLHQPTTLGELDVDTSFEQHRWRHATRAGDRCLSGALHLVLSAPGVWPSCRGRRPRVADRRWRARFDDEGRAVKKPVMATKDLRFFDLPGAQQLPDGHPRRKMSVVAALSEWRVHIDRRHNESWIQRYEDGIPVTGLVPIADDGTRGTTVRFLAHKELRAADHFLARDLLELTSVWPQLSTVIDWQRLESGDTRRTCARSPTSPAAPRRRARRARWRRRCRGARCTAAGPRRRPGR